MALGTSRDGALTLLRVAVPWSHCPLSQHKMSLLISGCGFFFFRFPYLFFLLLLMELPSSISSLLCSSPLFSHFLQNADNLCLCGTFPSRVTESYHCDVVCDLNSCVQFCTGRFRKATEEHAVKNRFGFERCSTQSF